MITLLYKYIILLHNYILEESREMLHRTINTNPKNQSDLANKEKEKIEHYQKLRGNTVTRGQTRRESIYLCQLLGCRR